MFNRIPPATVLILLLAMTAPLLAKASLTVALRGLAGGPYQAIRLALFLLTSAAIVGFLAFMRHAVKKTAAIIAAIAAASYATVHASSSWITHYNGAIFAATVTSTAYILIVFAYEAYDYYLGPLPLDRLSERMQLNPRGTLYKLQQPEYVQSLIAQLRNPEEETPVLLDLIGLYLTHAPCYSLFGYKDWETQATSINPQQYFSELTQQRPFGLITTLLVAITALSLSYQIVVYAYTSIYAPETLLPGALHLSLTLPAIAFILFTLFKMRRRRQLARTLDRLRNFYIRCETFFGGHYHAHFRIMRFIRDIDEVNMQKGASKAERTAAKARLLIDFFTRGRPLASNYALPERLDLYHAIASRLKMLRPSTK